MGTELNLTPPPPDPPGLPDLARVGPLDLYPALLADARAKTTLVDRAQDVAALARFLRAPGPAEACALLVAGGAGQANAIGMAYRHSLSERGLAAATVNRRLSTLRKVVKLARRFGLIDWAVELDDLPGSAYRDTRGPGHSGWVGLLEAALEAARAGPRGRRNLTMVLLLHDHGLRESEVTRLDLADWDADSGRLQVLGKGKAAKAPVTVNSRTILALSRWLMDRGPEPGPLFVRLDNGHAGRGERLDGEAVAEAVAALGRAAGLGRRVTPHGLRHQGITRVLELSNGNIDAAQKFARHADPKTTQRYNDNRSDVAGAMARLLGDDA